MIYTGEEKKNSEIKFLLEKCAGEFVLVIRTESISMNEYLYAHENNVDCMIGYNPKTQFQETYYCGTLISSMSQTHLGYSKPKIRVDKHIQMKGGSISYPAQILNVSDKYIDLKTGDDLRIGNEQVAAWLVSENISQLKPFLKTAQILKEEKQGKKLIALSTILVKALQEYIVEAVVASDQIKNNLNRKKQDEEIEDYKNKISFFESFLDFNT